MASHSCASRAAATGVRASAATLELAIKQALDDAAPDLEGLEVEGVVEAPAAAPSAADGVTGMELPLAPGGGGAPMVDGMPPLPSGSDSTASRASDPAR